MASVRKGDSLALRSNVFAFELELWLEHVVAHPSGAISVEQNFVQIVMITGFVFRTLRACARLLT